MLCQLITLIKNDCVLLYKQSSWMKLKYVNYFLGAKILDIMCYDHISKMASASKCIKMTQCFYLTIDRTSNVCTFYNQGSTKYNTTNLLIYALEVPLTAVIFMQLFIISIISVLNCVITPHR